MTQDFNHDARLKSVTKTKVNELIVKLQKSPPVSENFVPYDTKFEVDGNHDETTFQLMVPYNNSHNYFKRHLFKDRLSHVALSLNHHAHSKGFYMHSAWVNKDGIIHPLINLNPIVLHSEPIKAMSTLVHEQCHHFQFLYGHPGRGGYHNKQFAELMEYIGLMCSHTGKPGGNKTGERMRLTILFREVALNRPSTQCQKNS